MFFRNLLLIMLFVVSNTAHSATVSGKLIGQNLQWYSAISTSNTNTLKPAQWIISGNISPGTMFTQQSITTSGSGNIELRNASGEVVSTTLTISGSEYVSPNATSLLSNNGDTTITMSGSNISASGVGVGNHVVQLSTASGNASTPFTHYRPLFRLPNIVKDFKGKPAGTYVGNSTVVLTYNYVRNDITISNTITGTLVFEIEYVPSVIDSIVFQENDKIIEIVYNLNGTVSGEVDFNGKATGIFPNGLNIEALSSLYSFSLQNVSGDRIPYDITCITCNTNLVSNGNKLLENGIISNINNNIDLVIKIGFSNIILSEITDGLYTDTVTLMFKPNL
ncbi:hypothetical protein [Shewanella baltica]|uniref:Uncharacterized protein n=1 Tax=Shewanella baltica (strain OS195) TaxID=399599 RepID=A9L068_SHEB9|nr:hypothetical protein [Shewanella baltica]ABS06754.1 hypothetical protein Shew185_0592 [Shewanella baltica OS185]ABX47797.1 hypothetical protein Sbal195_0619 [Shewanella baltica OS195]ACK45149.1 hypothetical protein Sbal223_0624 [Shewanella baltica OS223]AEG09974.1 hypothetical protein Sbal175_0687 [Shewanella baltica BA175]EHC04030.1 hypothetical protein Sbal625DRAFT_4309 [Shewanella baltica OS625]